MELVSVNKSNQLKDEEIILPQGKSQSEQTEQLLPLKNKVVEYTPFIEANTKEVSLSCLKNDCIIPVFAKDNERTISHHEFVETTYECVKNSFSGHQIEQPEIRVSHQIKGRIPEAINKPVKELLDFEKTQYYERFAFIIRVPSVTETINGNKISLMIGGVRGLNRENLYSKKSMEKFQVFIGFQNMVCCNLCISTDGYKSDIRVSSVHELKEKIQELISSYQIQKHFDAMKNLTQQFLTEQQFAQLIGRAKLYQYLPKEQKLNIPTLLMSDSQISTIAKDYYQDERFCKNEQGNINLWDVYNLFTSANKSSYIDNFLDKNVNAFKFSEGVSKAINDDSNHWFLG